MSVLEQLRASFGFTAPGACAPTLSTKSATIDMQTNLRISRQPGSEGGFFARLGATRGGSPGIFG